MAETETSNQRARRRFVDAGLSLGVLRFGGPLVVGMVLHTLFNLVDMFMISRLPDSSAALAALGLCDMVAAVATILSNGIATAAVALITRHVGAGHLSGVRRATYQSLLLVVVLSVVFGLIGWFGSDLIVRRLMFAKGDTADVATAYLEVILGGSFSIFLLLHLTAVLRALGHAKTATVLLVSGNALNVLLNVFFIYGDGPSPEVFAWGAPVARLFGIPRLGVLGAAYATVIARSVPVVIGLWLLARRRGGPRFHPLYLRPNPAVLRSLLRIGWPASLQLVLRVSSILVFIALINAEYTTIADQSALTAYSICLRLETMALFVGMGWGAAASSFVGANLGAGHEGRAKRAGYIAAGYNLAMMLALAALYVRYSDALLGIFDTTPAVLAIGHEYLSIVAFSYAFLGVGVVLSQAMTGAGATLSSLVLDAASLLGVILPAAYVVAATLDLPRTSLFWVISLGNVGSAVLYVGYYGTGAFLRKQLR
ncbi:MAG: MATE family efflux transporter [Polyangiales bacterium]|nr:MATE family efflux transporter [Myxococcales bacterium]